MRHQPNVGLTSQMVCQHWSNIGSMSHVFWEAMISGLIDSDGTDHRQTQYWIIVGPVSKTAGQQKHNIWTVSCFSQETNKQNEGKSTCHKHKNTHQWVHL